MMSRIAGWTIVEDSESAVQVPPSAHAGEIFEGIRYLERRRPIATPEDIVRTLPVPHGAELVSMSRPRSLVTDEGEYASLVIAQNHHAGHLIHRAIGIVHVDDFDAVTIGHTRRPEAFAEMEQLVESSIRTERHFMSLRRRPYRCAELPWILEPAGMFTHRWSDGERSITTWPAIPLDGASPHVAVERMIGIDFANAESSIVRALGGLTGHRFTIHAAGVIDVAVLVDHRFVYAASYVGASADDGTFASLVESIEPIPRDRWHDKPQPASFAHWVD